MRVTVSMAYFGTSRSLEAGKTEKRMETDTVLESGRKGNPDGKIASPLPLDSLSVLVFEAMEHVARCCSSAYKKNLISFDIIPLSLWLYLCDCNHSEFQNVMDVIRGRLLRQFQFAAP